MKIFLVAVPMVFQGQSPPPQRPAFDVLMAEAGQKMHHGMAAARPTGNPDVDFVRMMIPHHQGAVEMAKALLLHGHDHELQQLAKSIITDQENEIRLGGASFRSARSGRPTPSTCRFSGSSRKRFTPSGSRLHRDPPSRSVCISWM